MENLKNRGYISECNKKQIHRYGSQTSGYQQEKTGEGRNRDRVLLGINYYRASQVAQR